MQSRFVRLTKSGTKPSIATVGLIGLVLGLTVPAYSDVTYTYTGPDFVSAASPYTTSDHVTATMTLANPLDPNNFQMSPVGPTAFYLGSDLVALSMSDGVHTLDLNTPGVTGGGIVYAVDSSGDITEWDIGISLPAGDELAAVHLEQGPGAWRPSADPGGLRAPPHVQRSDTARH